MDDLPAKNPYEGHSQLSPLEQEVCWEYARMHFLTKKLAAALRDRHDAAEANAVIPLRNMERKMGTVMTLFKASWWGHVNSVQAETQSDPDEDETVADLTVTA